MALQITHQHGTIVGMKKERSTGMSADQLVAYNLRRARLARGWTQEELAEKLEPHLGTRMSRASLSWAETSATGGRRREFTATEILAFSLTFDLPMTWFFLPPHEPNTEPIVTVTSGLRTLSIGELLNQILGESDEVWERVIWLLHDVPDEERTELQDAAAKSAAFLVAAQMRALLFDVEGDIAGLEKLERWASEIPEHKRGVRRQLDLLRGVRQRTYAQLNAEHESSYRQLVESAGWTGRAKRTARAGAIDKPKRSRPKKGAQS